MKPKVTPIWSLDALSTVDGEQRDLWQRLLPFVPLAEVSHNGTPSTILVDVTQVTTIRPGGNPANFQGLEGVEGISTIRLADGTLHNVAGTMTDIGLVVARWTRTWAKGEVL